MTKTSNLMARTTIFALILVATVACEESIGSGDGGLGDGGSDTCQARSGTQDVFAEGVIQRANLNAREVEIFSPDGNSNKNSLITLSFEDTTPGFVDSRIRNGIGFSNICVGFTGRPVVVCRDADNQDCDPLPLGADDITVSGLAGDDVDLTIDGPGRYQSNGTTVPLFGTEDVQLSVSSAGGDDTFPDYTQAIPSPLGLIVSIPQPNSTYTVAEDLVVTWNRGNGDYVEVELRSEASVSARVLCVVEDSGCIAVPFLAVSWLVGADPSPELTLSVRRVVDGIERLNADASTRMRASTGITMFLEPN